MSKEVKPMASPRPLLPIRPEIERMMLTCEYLLASVTETPLNDDERAAIELYRADLAKVLAGAAAPVKGSVNGASMTVMK